MTEHKHDDARGASRSDAGLGGDLTIPAILRNQGNLVAEKDAEIARLRTALAALELACDRRAALLTPDAYNAAEAAPGMRDALCALDDARLHARTCLGPNA